MKHCIPFFAVILLVLSGYALNAQEEISSLDDYDRIGIAPYVSDQVEYLPEGARYNLQSKLGQIITANGLGNASYNTRFILTPNVQVAQKYVIGGAPPRVALNLDIHLFIGDGLEGTKFGTATVSVKGVGSNENKAYINALKQLRPGNPLIERMISSAKRRILEYYNSQCGFIIREAELAAAQSNFGRALHILTTVPRINQECYDRASELIGPVYQQKIDRDCQINLQAARNSWNTGKDYQSALTAVEYLQNVEPDSGCFDDAQQLSNDIGRRISEIDDREWNFVMKNQGLEEKRIEAARAVGVAYGQNQPENMTYNLRGWW